MSTLIDRVKSISIKDYTYDLPDSRIAKYPVEPRDSSKLLLYRDGEVSESRFYNLADYLQSDSLLVYNNTKVIHARLFFHKETGAQIEIFCLEPLAPADYAQNFQAKGACEWLCLVGNLKKWKAGKLVRDIHVGGKDYRLSAEHLGLHDKTQHIRFEWISSDGGENISFGDLLEQAGTIPIPPYLNRESEACDEKTYQTVYSRVEGSVAAPTAGLHFTPEVLQAVDNRNVERAEVTLHVSASTFQPVKSERIEGHPMHLEFITVERELLEKLLRYEGRITAVGTTSVRTLESLYWFGVHFLETKEQADADGETDVFGHWVLDQWYPYQSHPAYLLKEAIQAVLDHLISVNETTFNASTRLLIAPGYTFHVVCDMLTNFHQPQSTLLLLVSAFVGGDWRKIYDYALSHGFRFLSYGDSSLLHR